MWAPQGSVRRVGPRGPPLGLGADSRRQDTCEALSVVWQLQVRGYELPATDPEGQANRQTRPCSGLKIKTHFRAKLLGPRHTTSGLRTDICELVFETHVHGAALGGPSVPSPHVLCKAGPTRAGLPSASVHTARGWGHIPGAPRFVTETRVGGRRVPPDLPGWIGAGFCWQLAGPQQLQPPDVACCQLWGAGSAWSPKGHSSQPGFTAESSRSPEKTLAPGSPRTAGSLGSGPGHHTHCQPPPLATPAQPHCPGDRAALGWLTEQV